jgi:hypothetical protein
LHPDPEAIRERQDAIKELAALLDLRQHIQASGTLYTIKKDDIEKLRSWIGFPSAFSSPAVYYCLLIFPIATLATLILYLVTGQSNVLTIFSGLFILNFLITSLFLKKTVEES